MRENAKSESQRVTSKPFSFLEVFLAHPHQCTLNTNDTLPGTKIDTLHTGETQKPKPALANPSQQPSEAMRRRMNKNIWGKQNKNK